MSKGKVVAGAFFGAIAGFVAGILTAPKSGKETREDIKNASLKAKDTAVEKAEDARDFVVEKAGEAKDAATKTAQEVKAKASEVVEDATDKAVELKGRTEQAIEGAKKGFAKKPKAKK